MPPGCDRPLAPWYSHPLAFTQSIGRYRRPSTGTDDDRRPPCRQAGKPAGKAGWQRTTSRSPCQADRHSRKGSGDARPFSNPRNPFGRSRLPILLRRLPRTARREGRDGPLRRQVHTLCAHVCGCVQPLGVRPPTPRLGPPPRAPTPSPRPRPPALGNSWRFSPFSYLGSVYYGAGRCQVGLERRRQHDDRRRLNGSQVSF